MSNESKITLFVAGLSLAGTIYMEMSSNERKNADAIASSMVKIAALEAHEEDGKTEFERIEHKIDKIDAKLDRIISWAGGRTPKP